MAKIVFKCLQCGRCCKDLIKELEGGLSGFSFSPDEKNLFPNELISPNVGIGWGMPGGPKYVTAYQLNVGTCPNLSKGNLCSIHDKRPLTCQAFPLIPTGSGGTAIAEPDHCAFVEEVERKLGSLNSILPVTPKKFIAPKEWQAIAKINSWATKSVAAHPMDTQVLWVFDLKDKEWQIWSAV